MVLAEAQSKYGPRASDLLTYNLFNLLLIIIFVFYLPIDIIGWVHRHPFTWSIITNRIHIFWKVASIKTKLHCWKMKTFLFANTLTHSRFMPCVRARLFSMKFYYIANICLYWIPKREQTQSPKVQFKFLCIFFSILHVKQIQDKEMCERGKNVQ